MRPDWSALKARISNRLARHFGGAPFRLQNKAPMVSFTFDDTPKSAATVGGEILDAYNARATFYVAGGLVDQWSGHWDGISADEIINVDAAIDSVLGVLHQAEARGYSVNVSYVS